MWPLPAVRSSQDAPAALLAATFELSFYSPADEAYLPLPLQAVMLDSIGGSSSGGPAPGRAGGPGSSGGSGRVLLLLTEEPFAATEWEVCWELPAGAPAASAFAEAILPRLRVNPRACSEAAAAAAGLGRQLPLPPPLAASLTVVLTAESGSLALLTPAPLLLLQGQQQQQHGAAALLDTAAVLHAGCLKLALHTYPAPEGSSLLAADLQATLALCLADSSSATAPPAAAAGWAVLEPFQLNAAVEYSSLTPFLPRWPSEVRPQQEKQQAGGLEEQQGRQEQQPSMFWQAVQQQLELPLLAVRPPPLGQGLAVQLAAQQQPVILNASESCLAEVKRLVAVLSAPGSNGASSAAAASSPPPAPAAPPLLLVNRSGVSVQVRQEGTEQQHLVLLEGQRLPLVWPAPPALVPGAKRRLQLALAGGAEGEAAWSVPFDVS